MTTDSPRADHSSTPAAHRAAALSALRPTRSAPVRRWRRPTGIPLPTPAQAPSVDAVAEARAVLDRLEPTTLAIALSTLSPAHELLVAARLAVETVDARHQAARDHVETTAAIRDGIAESGGIDHGAARMWQARAEVDGPHSRAAAKARELGMAS